MLRVPTTQDLAPSVALLGASGALAVALYLATRMRGERKGEAKKPHRLPSTSSLLGDLPAYLANEDRIHDWMAEMSARFNDEEWILHIPGQKDIVMFTQPAAVEDILATQFDKFDRGAFQIELLEVMFGQSIVNSDGKRWYHQRKAATKFFTANSLRTCMVTSMHKNIHQIYDVIDAAIAANRSFDLGKLFHEFALQTFTEVGLGVDLRWIGLDTPNPLAESMHTASSATLRRFRLPGFYWRLQRLLNVGSEYELATSMESIRSWIRSVIAQSLESVRTKQSSGNQSTEKEVKSVMELFMAQSHENVEGMGPDDLVDFILTFVLAAYDTSSTSLTWLFLMLTKHPRVEAKIRLEMAAVLPTTGATADTYLTTDHVQKLVYLEATIKEVLRLYPAIPLLQRVATEDTVIAGNTFVRKDTLVGIAPYAIARSTRVWGPDASKFKPERWIDPTTGTLLAVPSCQFNTFSAGPRICVGMKLAMMELRVATANLLHRYEFELAIPNDASYTAAMGLALKDPLMVHARRTTA